jgi:nucleotide-binding universal stress UspA family protein
MSFEGVVAIGLAINLVCALICSFIASRSGHDPFSWALAGGLIGPFGVIALLAAKSRDGSAETATGRAPRAGKGDTLLPTDGSEPSLAAVDHFIESHRRGSGVTLLAVLPVEHREAPGPELEAEIESHVGEARRRLEREGLRCRVETRYGDPAAEIVRFAAEGGFDHILMGRRGRGGVARLLLGSVSEKVLKDSPIPVTVAG